MKLKKQNFWKIVKSIFIIFSIFLFSCNKQWKIDLIEISQIPDASGICFYEENKTFFVVNDEWKIFQIDKSGNILAQKYLWDYDFEGISCDFKNELLYLLLEDSWNILKLDVEKLDITWKYILDIKKEEREKYFWKNKWAEWLIFDNKNFYISTQKSKNNLLKFSIKNKEELKLEKIYNIDYKDLSWLTFYKNNLYIISDKNEKIFIYDLENEKIKVFKYLQKWKWEWISFDENWIIYLADDSGKVFIKN